METSKAVYSLEQVLAYENRRVLNKFRTLFSLNDVETQEIFIELKKWLWLCAIRKEGQLSGRSQTPRALVIHASMVVIDELWHAFVLHTEDYAQFCDQYFGFFVHHFPGNPDFVPMSEAETQAQLEYIWEQLGEETVLKWYEDFAVRYSPERLRELMKPPIFGRPCEAV